MTTDTDDPTAPRAPAEIDQRILDGALEAIAAYGTRRASIDNIAAAAHVGRATVFRRFGSKDELVARLAEREIARLLAAVTERSVGAIEDRFTESFVVFVEFARDHPWLSRLLRNEPGTLLQLLRNETVAPLNMGADFIHARLHAAAPARPCDPVKDQWLADGILRAAFGFVLFPPPAIDLSDEETVRAFARVTIGPLAAHWAA